MKKGLLLMPKGLCRVNAIVPIEDSVPFFL